MNKDRRKYIPVPDGFMQVRFTLDPDRIVAKFAMRWRFAHD